jgi:hypothetical protein
MQDDSLTVTAEGGEWRWSTGSAGAGRRSESGVRKSYNDAYMFFRREKPRTLTLDDHLNALGQAGFAVEAAGSGKTKVSKYGFTATIEDGPRVSGAPGFLVGGEAAELVDGGFQKFWRTAAGKRFPVRAADLRSLHDFQEDLKEALGLVSLYNEGLGSTSAAHAYDRVKGRDSSGVRRPWERA